MYNTRVITAGFSAEGRIMLFDNNIDNFSAIPYTQRKTPAKAEGFSGRAGARALRSWLPLGGSKEIPFSNMSTFIFFKEEEECLK